MDLKEFRACRGFQRKFAVKKIGISGKHLNDIEAGRVNLTRKVANKLANFYGADINAIEAMYLEGKMKREEILKRQSQLLKKVDSLSERRKVNVPKKIRMNTTAERHI